MKTTTVRERAEPIAAARLRDAVRNARRGVLAAQRDDGHWRYEFEADCTIPAEYVLMMHFLDEIDVELQRKLAVYLRAKQADHGGWPLYHGGAIDISCTVKVYWALKLAGDDPDAPHMVRAREAIHAVGGAARANVFTRFALAMFGQIPWRAVPFVPVELVLMPRWAPFHLGKVSYWSRTVCVPLAVLYTLRAKAANPTGIGIPELFVVPPDEERDWFPIRSKLNQLLLWIERTVRQFEPLIPEFVRRRALRVAEEWFLERLNGLDGLGGIFPAMVNALEAMHVLGYPKDHPLRVVAKQSIERLVVDQGDRAYCQPCVSPIWDTALALLALDESQEVAPEPHVDDALRRAGDWIVSKQIVDGPADWRAARPNLDPGGWPFQYANDYYPDVDDTSAVLWGLHRVDRERWHDSIERGLRWTCGMQSSNGGFGAFDVDNDNDLLLEIPFADHGALLDPPTADVSARTLAILAVDDRPEYRENYTRVLEYLLAEQEPDGSWFGRWGTNYVYGTWCVLAGFEFVQDDARVDAARERAVAWLESVQKDDGGWGESNDSYEAPELAGRGQPSSSFQTAWAVLALLASGRSVDSPSVARGVRWLIDHQLADGLWSDPWFTAPGFPRVFYLRYHGYSAYFPLWALSRALRSAGSR